MACDRKTYNPNNMRRGIGCHSGSSFFVFNSNLSLALRRQKCIKQTISRKLSLPCARFLMHASFALLIDKVKNFVHYIKKDSILKRTA